VTTLELAERINPRRYGFSPKMSALVGAIIGHDYGVRDRKGGQLGHLSITSDGYIIAASTAHESGAFVGAADDLDENLRKLFHDAKLTEPERAEFFRRYSANVTDWRHR
jgi:hypothetical protein